ncbi:universal stress protein [Arthrobacter crystallopoietes]|uniref:Nucleotide-binding universal stress protein, UspA family n=1 Tax=Crystallibacter crystallopoietes TaxID=37928 RepID=A0A1H1E5K1_9MICC|nr:universal stress protein [Arthrobacter crystallopoietes]AUI50034.1 universal stress protein UspA [Arthrobacter crystallopoietes]SDQ83984.1 Nucleotide-binding universal stress protein, UspA family [Arthrobacter crystallopoietes]
MSIVVGYIPTPEGEAALERAIREAANAKAPLVVVNSTRGDVFVDQRFVQSDAAQALDSRLAASGVEHILLQPMGGNDAADEVLDAAETHRADLIVIGLRKRTPVGKLIMGSTAQRILLQAECPVLAVKA